MRRMTFVSMAVLALALAIGAGAAQAKLDPSFGQGGVATLSPPAPTGWTNEQLEAAATGQNGETYVVARQLSSCASYPCTEGDYVFRYLANGALEPAFGGSRGYEVPLESTDAYQHVAPLVTVDSAGRPVVGSPAYTASEGNSAIVIRRLLKSGGLDTGFGVEGAVRLPCPCQAGSTQLLAGAKQSLFVVARSETRKKRNGQKSGATASATLIKLDSTGHRSKGYGVRGSVTANMPGEGEIEYDAIAPEGATYFGGRGLTKATRSGFLVRVTAQGKIDGKFKQRALEALSRLKAVKGNEVRVTAAVIGSKGPIELFGSAGSIGGFELRLHRDGTLFGGWAEKGLALLPFPITAAVQGREGSTMALTGEEAAPPRLLRILSDGKLDPVFGRTGELLSGANAAAAFSLFPAGLGRVGVTELGQNTCQAGKCEATGRIYRFLEGR